MRIKHLAAVLICWTVTGFPFNTVDGDTFDARLRIRAAVWQQTIVEIEATERIRLLDIDTPEMRRGSPEDRDRGARAKMFTHAWLSRGPVEVYSCERDSFGRPLAVITRDGESLAEVLDAAGHAK